MKFSVYYRFPDLSTFKTIAHGARDLMTVLEKFGMDHVQITKL